MSHDSQGPDPYILSYPSQTFGMFHIPTHKITEIRYTWAGLNRGHSEHMSQGEDDAI